MATEEDSILLFNTLRLLSLDLDLLSSTYRVPLSTSMFAKVNPKGMALLLHTLLTSFNSDYNSRFATCWFPYTLVELKEFK